jgi:hypothetical protein
MFACVAFARASTTAVSTSFSCLLGEALHGGDQIKGQVGTALILVLHFGLLRLGGFILGRERVVTAAG